MIRTSRNPKEGLMGRTKVPLSDETSIPAAMRPAYDAIVAMTDAFAGNI